MDGELLSLVMPFANTDCMNVFLNELSEAYAGDYTFAGFGQRRLVLFTRNSGSSAHPLVPLVAGYARVQSH